MSEELRQKIKRVKPLIRARKAILDRESVVLAQLKQRRHEILNLLQMSQTEYIGGVQKLNQLRESSDRKGHEAFEDSVTFAREKWIRCYRQAQTIEREIEMQLQAVVKAQGHLKSIEKLEERYVFAWREYLSKKEQQSIDEKALEGFLRRREG